MHAGLGMHLERYLLFILHVITSVVIKLQSPSQGAEIVSHKLNIHLHSVLHE